MKTIKSTIAILIITIFVLSCSKPDNGKDGATGKDGVTGNANVFASEWKSASTILKDTLIDGTCLKIKDLVVPELTQNIIDSGVMIVYFKVGTNFGPYQLPYTSNAGDSDSQIGCVFKLGKIIISRHTFNSCRRTSATILNYPGEPVMLGISNNALYRYVFIPNTNAGKINASIIYKKMGYEELFTTLNLKG